MNNSLSLFGDEGEYPQDRVFTRSRIDSILNSVKGKTLGDVDSKNLIMQAMQARPDKVQKGIAGDVIEVSVLGCSRDSNAKPDILVDGKKTELKTTGVVKTKDSYEPKEYLTITGISKDTILLETFETSRFFHKIENLLFVFYHYNTKTAKCSADYLAFPILGHLFWGIPDSDKEMLRNDWQLVQEFVQNHDFLDDEARHQLKSNLMLIDYSSPQQPRFRLKKPFVSTILDSFLQQEETISLNHKITKFDDIDILCHSFTLTYGGQSLEQIFPAVNVKKDICQEIVLKMFGSPAQSINQIRELKEIGLTAKTIILDPNGGRTEDMKMCQVDFDEWFSKDSDFGGESAGSSSLYSYFADSTFLFVIFQEPYKNAPLNECLFRGFKRYRFPDTFLTECVKPVWDKSRSHVFDGTLREEPSGRGYAPNFPKSKDGVVFLRGSGSTTSDRKPRLYKWGFDIKMYIQWVWVRGDYLVEELSETSFL